MSFIYLASPYSSKSESVRRCRVKRAARLAWALNAHGTTVYAPIVHGQGLVDNLRKERVCCEWEPTWRKISFDMLEAAEAVIVDARHPSWLSSTGVQAEIKRAHEVNKPVAYITPGGGFSANAPSRSGRPLRGRSAEGSHYRIF